MNNNIGKLIVFEGTDGSGKTTQSELLINYFKKTKTPSAYISFPRYAQSPWGNMIRRFLDGEFGKLNEVNPYLASVLYAEDRMSAKSQIKNWLASGKIVVCNRYIGSNIAHMSAKIKNQKSKIKYIKWLEKLEYGENGIPKEDLVILLQVPVAITGKLMAARNLDIHESNFKYLEEVYKAYDEAAKKRKNWVRIDCTKKGKLLKPSEIHAKVLEVLKKQKIIL